jgi:hypothetical protein
MEDVMAKKPRGKKQLAPDGMLYGRNWRELPEGVADQFKTWAYAEYQNHCLQAGKTPLPIERTYLTVNITLVGINARVWDKKMIEESKI